MAALGFILCTLAIPGLVAAGGRQIGRLAVLWFFISWLSQGLALPLSIINLLLSLWQMTTGQMSLALMFMSASALYGLVHWRNRQAGKYLVNRTVTSTGAMEESTTVSPCAGFLPLKRHQSGVKCLRDIPYSDSHPRHLLDIYLPESLPDTSLPVLIDVHGGAWVTGQKSQQALPLINWMASRGWLCVSMSYRLGPHDRFPAMIEDVLRVIAWVKQHAADYGGNSQFVALSGGSAGGHLVSLAALASNDAAFKPGFESMDTQVQAVVSLYGRYDLTDRNQYLGHSTRVVTRFMETRVLPKGSDVGRWWNLASPVDRVHADAPPFLIIHGTHDSLIPVEEARDFFEALDAVSPDRHLYVELGGIQHAYDLFNSALTRYHVVAIEAYLSNLYQHSTTTTALTEN